MDAFQENRFRRQVDAALGQVRTILENNRKPQLASDVTHSYTDKYAMVELLCNATLLSFIEIGQFIGFTKENIKSMKQWEKAGQSVSLRLDRIHNCSFSHKKERKIESATQHVTKVSGLFTATDKVVTTVTDYYWNFTSSYCLSAFPASCVEEKISLLDRNGSYTIVTTADVSPQPVTRIYDALDVNITWLFRHMSEELEILFHVDRNDPNCHTPRRNPDIEEACEFVQSFFHWATKVCSYFSSDLFRIQSHNYDLSMINVNGVFIPVLPLLDAGTTDSEASRSRVQGNLVSAVPYSESSVGEGDKEDVLLSGNDLDLFLKEQMNNLENKISQLQKAFPQDKDLVTSQEATIMLICWQIKRLCQHFSDGVDFVESMLRQQLITAIGKEIGAKEFNEYMTFHFRKIFKDYYQPKLFCYAVRRPEHSPEGVVSIESRGVDGNQAICSMVKCLEAPSSLMKFPISAATKITFGGERFVHAWVSHKFSSSMEMQLNVVARARQFSSFILMIGNVTAADEFQPRNGIIIQNKDDLLIPLLTEVIPTPKAFKKSVESLSPTQREFAKAFRGMQLESTLFAMCIIQIKPQLEKVLNLPNDSLTKEILLTQDLMELFIEYQIPSDLISFEEEEGVEVTGTQRVAVVKRHVEAMKEMIEQSKQKEIEEARQKAQFNNPVPRRSGLLADIRSAPILKSAPPPPAASTTFEGATNLAGLLGNIMSSRRSVNVLDDDEDDDWGDDFDDDWDDDFVATKPPPPPPSAPTEPQSDGRDADSSQGDSSMKDEEKGSSVREKEDAEKEIGDVRRTSGLQDFTKLPGVLNKNFDALDTDAALHATILKTGDTWTKKFQKGLLATASEEQMGEEKQNTEKNKAFDLLDALSRSGALSIDAASLHVVVAATHCFDRTLINTVIQDNVNPIEKVERSALIIASTIHEEEPELMIKDDHLSRIRSGPSSHLFS